MNHAATNQIGITEQHMVSCTDRLGRQHSCTFDVPLNVPRASVIRQGWQEAIRLCGSIEKIGSAFISTLNGDIIGTLR